MEPREGIRSAEIVDIFQKASAFWELYHIYCAELRHLGQAQQIDILVILYNALQSGRLSPEMLDLTTSKSLPRFFTDIVRLNPELSYHLLNRVIPVVVMRCLLDWETIPTFVMQILSGTARSADHLSILTIQ